MRSRATDVIVDDAAAHHAALDLLAGVAHDLRSPLTSILYLVESMQGNQVDLPTPLLKRQLGLVYSATYQLSMLVNDLTELAHDGGLPLLEPKAVPLSLSAILGAVHDLTRPVAEERGVALCLVSDAADRRLGHPAALTRMLLNLVTNALRVTAEGHVEIRVTELAAESVAFSVSDSGPGIAPEAMATLFDPFPDPARRGISSTGLGLAICRKLAQAMRSELTVESRPGAGACFRFVVELPANASR